MFVFITNLLFLSKPSRLKYTHLDAILKSGLRNFKIWFAINFHKQMYFSYNAIVEFLKIDLNKGKN